MAELKPCPFCGGENVKLSSNSELCGYNGLDIPVYRYRTYMRCRSCGARGPLSSGRTLSMPDGFKLPSWATTKEKIEAEAIAAWNRRAQPENEPLTPTELQRMVGEWVWIEHMASPASRAEPGEWLKLKSCSPTRSRPYVDFENKSLCLLYYGQAWLAYRRRPE